MGIGAHVAELRRTSVGVFQIDRAITLEQLQESVAEESLGRVLLTPDAVLAHLPAVDLTDDDVRKARNGVNISVQQTIWTNGEQVRLRDEHGRLVAVASFEAEKNSLRPRVVLGHEET
jgi:tRNA pseudouridine55 synthase